MQENKSGCFFSEHSVVAVQLAKPRIHFITIFVLL